MRVGIFRARHLVIVRYIWQKLSTNMKGEPINLTLTTLNRAITVAFVIGFGINLR